MLVIRGAEAAYALKTRQQSPVPSLRTGDVDLPRQSQFRDNRAATSNVVRSKDRKRQRELVSRESAWANCGPIAELDALVGWRTRCDEGEEEE